MAMKMAMKMAMQFIMRGFRRWSKMFNICGISAAPVEVGDGAGCSSDRAASQLPTTTKACPVSLPGPGTRSLYPRTTQGILIMVVIRLARGGAKKRPFYNIVVADARERRDGRFIERVGFYNPVAAGGEQPLRVALDRVTHWASVGAQLSPTVARLVDQAKKAA